jgi:bifunctional aspartokinase / homoserine dehydrogenase 1
MSAFILRVGGDIINKPSTIANLKLFMSMQDSKNILVISSLFEIKELVMTSFEQVKNDTFKAESLDSNLSLILDKFNVPAPSTEFLAQTNNLKRLLQGIQLTGDYSPALKDNILSYSETLSALILSALLELNQISSAVKLPAEIGLVVTPDFGNATCLSLDKETFHNESLDTVLIIPGSYGVTSQGKTARTGGDSADYTAAFIAGELNADRLVLWGAGSEFFAADRRIVPTAEKIPRLTYSEASELSYFDHYTLHPRAVEPLVKKHIPIHVIDPESSGFEPDTIINTEDYISDRIVKSVAGSNDLSILKLNGPGVGMKPGILAQITGKLSEEAINIKSVITSQVSINILLDNKSGAIAVKAAQSLGFTAVNEIELLENISLIAIVGHGMQYHYGISATLFSSIAKNKINVILNGSGASDLVSYLVVRDSDYELSIAAIYDAFFGEHEFPG